MTNDLFFADWGLLHFHLGFDIAATGKRVTRSRRVLIAHLTNTDAFLVDVVAHGSGYADAWGEKSLLETVYRNWPHLLEPYRVNSISLDDAAHQLSAYDYVKLRESGVNASIKINGSVFMTPGLGVSSDGSSTRAVIYAMKMLRELDSAEKDFRLQFPDEEAMLVIRGNGQAGFYMPETKVLAVGMYSEDSFTTSVFNRLIDESGILAGNRMTHIWTPSQPTRIS